MNKQTTQKNIVNPEKWIGKYVRHMSNWMDFQFGDVYSVCEWTGTLMLTKEDAYHGDYFESKEEAEAAGYDECYYYSEAGLYQMWQRHTSKAA
jgi:hypothetical protein